MRGPPFSAQCKIRASGCQFPIEADFASHRRQRAVLCRVGGELVEREREALGGRGLQRDIRTADLDLVAGAIGRQLLGDQRAEIGAVPARSRTVACARATAP